jgi:hypothetical protein
VRDDELPQPADNRRESPTVTDGVLRLTYDQIGRRLGMTADAARQLARRKGWPRTRPNAIGEPVVVSVPTSELPSEQPAVHRRATDGEPSDDRRAIGGEPAVTDGPEPSSVNRRSDLHTQALVALEAALTAANTRAEEALALADRLAAQLADANGRADAEIATLRDMISGRLRDTVARAETRAVQAEQRATEAEAQAAAKDAELTEHRLAADQARTDAEAAQQVAEALQATVDELRAGQVAHAGELEQALAAAATVEARIASLEAEATAKVAQAEAAAERARAVAKEAARAAEALQTTIDGLKAGQTTMQDMYAEGLAVAQREAQEAKEVAEDFREAEEVRKARGRLRRAWDGLRGR